MQKKIQLPKEGVTGPEDHKKLIDDDDVEGHRAKSGGFAEPEGLIHRGPSTGGELLPQFPSTGGDVTGTDEDDEAGPKH